METNNFNNNSDIKEQPLVSIMMPVYNGEKTIEIAIKSLLLQTYTNWLCVIVNDCSTDNTKEIIEKYRNDKRFKIIHLPENKGRGNARQLAIKNAKGKYLTFLDADDFFHPEKLFKQVEVLEKNATLALVSIGIGSFDLQKNLCSLRGLGNEEIKFYKDGFNLPPFFPASVMLRFSFIKGIDYNTSLDVGEDFDFLIRCLRSNNKYYMLNDVMYYYEEVGAIKFRKLFRYQILSLKALSSIYKQDKVLLSVHLMSKILKIFYYLVYFPLFGLNKLIIKRGLAPNSKNIREFKSVLDQLIDI